MWRLSSDRKDISKDPCKQGFQLYGVGLPPLPPRRLPSLLAVHSPIGGGAGLLQQVLPQGLLPLSWGCGQEPRHAGSGPKHLHMSLLGRRVLGNLRLSHTF